MGVVVPLRPTPPRPKSAAERAVWRAWAPVDGRPVFSFDRWRAAEIVRVAASRKAPGVEWVSAFACHMDFIARRLEPVPDDGEIARSIARLVGLVVPITPAVAEFIDDGRCRYRPRAYDLAVELCVTPVEKIRLGLRTIRDITETSDVMHARRLARRRARDAAKRRAAGAEPHEIRAMRRALAGALATAANISQATSYRWVKAAEKSGALDMSVVTECEFRRHVSNLLNKKLGRANSQNVTPAALRKRKSRDKARAEGAAQTAPGAVAVVPDRPTLAALAADVLTLPRDAVSFDPDRRAIVVQFRPVQPVPADLDPAPAFGNILTMAGWPIRSTAFDGATIEIEVGEAA